MVEKRPGLTFLAHAVLLGGVAVVAFPIYVTFVASTLTLEQIMSVPMPLVPGDQLIHNYTQVLTAGSTGGCPVPSHELACIRSATASLSFRASLKTAGGSPVSAARDRGRKPSPRCG